MSKYTLLCGYRRLQAHKKLGLKTIQAIVKNGNNKEKLITANIKDISAVENSRLHAEKNELSVLMRDIKENGLIHPIIVIIGKMGREEFLVKNTSENLHRKDLSPTELGRVVSLLKKEHGLNNGEISARLSMSENKIQNVGHIYEKIPKKFQKSISFGQKKGKLGVSIVSNLAELRLSKQNVSKVLTKAIKEEWTEREYLSFRSLVNNGVKTEKALASMKQYCGINLRLLISNKTMKAIKKDKGLSLRQYLIELTNNGDYPNLIVG